MPEIVIPHYPRKHQEHVYALMDKARFSVLVWHRRAGKTVGPGINYGIRKLLQCDKMMPRVGYFAPYRKQAKKIAWEYLKLYTRAFGKSVKVSESELSVTLPGNRKFMLYGADNPDSIRGEYFDHVILDEYGDIRESMWKKVIYPMTTDRNGSVLFMGTPKGRNQFHKIYQQAANMMLDGDKEWLAHMLTVDQSGVLTDKQIAQARAVMDPDEFDQEFMCSFVAAIAGAYFAHIIARIEHDGAIGDEYGHIPGHKVYTGWDLGTGTNLTVWFGQVVNKEFRIIDYHENPPKGNLGIDYACDVVKSKPYDYAEHFLPHDVQQPLFYTGRTRFELMQSILGPAVQEAQERLPPNDRIEASKWLLSRARIHKTRCTVRPNGEPWKGGLEGLKHYHREWDEKDEVWTPKPKGDWSSHSADGFGCLALGLQIRGVMGQVRGYTAYDPLAMVDIGDEHVRELEGGVEMGYDELVEGF